MCEQMGMGATRRASLSFVLLVLRLGTRRLLRGQLDDRHGVRCGSRMHRRTSRRTRVCGKETVSPADEPAQTQGLCTPVAQQASPVRSTRKLPGQHDVVEPTCSATLGVGAGVPYRVAVPVPLVPPPLLCNAVRAPRRLALASLCRSAVLPGRVCPVEVTRCGRSGRASLASR